MFKSHRLNLKNYGGEIIDLPARRRMCLRNWVIWILVWVCWVWPFGSYLSDLCVVVNFVALLCSTVTAIYFFDRIPFKISLPNWVPKIQLGVLQGGTINSLAYAKYFTNIYVELSELDR